jgi:3-oxoacyl-[acyl-carrier protein] reductase
LWDGVLHKMDDAQWNAVLACHLTAPFQLARAAAGHMRTAAKEELAAGGLPRDRCIVNVSSTSGLHGNVGQANYAAAKAGVVGLTKTQAKEWGPLGIRANAVAFGMIDTRMTNAFAADATVEVGGVAVPQGLPEHVAAAWGADSKMLSAIVPLGRKGTADEAAGGVLFLASPLASCTPEHGSNSKGPRRVRDAFCRISHACGSRAMRQT